MTTPSGRKVTAGKRRRIEKERGSTCLQSRRKKHLIKSPQEREKVRPIPTKFGTHVCRFTLKHPPKIQNFRTLHQ
jgi:hypothetical protein